MIRFIKIRTNPNIGFTENEIKILCENLDINLNEIIIDYLKTAGKKSNVLNVNYSSLSEFIEINNLLKHKLSLEITDNLNFDKILFLEKRYDGLKNEIYYFINLNYANYPIFEYSDGYIPIGVNFRDERTERIGLHNTEFIFEQYLNSRTENKFGATTLRKIGRWIMFILLFPFIFPFLLYLYFKTR